MPKDANFFIAQLAGALVLTAAHAQADVDALQTQVAELRQQLQAMTSERDTLKATQ